ncbi:MAG: aspartate-semialdehyde dehydrogenase [Spirochaetales bacterium]|jgi:aspartate-semialdehyde dehydrogenase|nr:aspartate-semialdehyde dehydrogenase [Spirochaetales bacterium]
MERIKVAVIGATGAVGQVFMWMLSDHPWFDVEYITASAARIGQQYGNSVHWVIPFEIPENIKPIVIEDYDLDAMREAGIKIVFSAMPADVAKTAEPELRENGFYVFSNAGALRYEKNVPILIPEANLDSLDFIKDQGYPDSGFVVTNANCVTTGLAIALAPLTKYGIKEISVSTYQSVSGAGYPGLSSFDITDNVIPFIAQEEEKIEKEIKKILTIDPEIYAYSVRVPVMFGHLETVWLTLENEADVDDFIRDWDEFTIDESGLPSSPVKPVVYSSDNTFPQPKYAFWGTPKGMVVYTGRVKKKHAKIGFTLMVNNVVKGAAGGSIQNAEAFVKRYGLE